MAEPTREDLIYNAWRSAVGKGGSASSPSAIEALFRRVRARAVAAVADMGERAALQAFPNLATDLLPYYERLLGLTDDPDLTEDQRRAVAAAQYTLEIASDVPGIQDSLQQLDERFAVVIPDPNRTLTTMMGRAFEDMAGAEPFGGGRLSTSLPNYSGLLVLRVVLELGDGVQPDADERRAMRQARQLLHDVLPAANDLQIVTHRGFKLDVSRLDLTSFDT
jgi:hypothetical protein